MSITMRGGGEEGKGAGQILFLCGKCESPQTHHGTQEDKGLLFPSIHPAKQTWVSQNTMCSSSAQVAWWV